MYHTDHKLEDPAMHIIIIHVLTSHSTVILVGETLVALSPVTTGTSVNTTTIFSTPHYIYSPKYP